MQGVRIGREIINTLIIADDIAFYAEAEDDLQNIFSNISKILWDNYGIQLNKNRQRL